MQNTQRTLLRELDLQIMQNRTPKQITAYLNTILDRRMRNLRQLLQSSAGQMEQFMILWEYQDCGFNRYRYVAVGTTCEGCTALDGQIFSIDEAEPGVNFGTLHPHCDCKTEILDANGNAVYTISSVKKEEKQKKVFIVDVCLYHGCTVCKTKRSRHLERFRKAFFIASCISRLADHGCFK